MLRRCLRTFGLVALLTLIPPAHAAEAGAGVRVSGTVEHAHADDFDHGRATDHVVARVAGTRQRVDLGGDRGLRPRDRVVLRARRVRGRLVLASPGVRRLARPRTLARRVRAATALGPRSTLVLRVAFPGEATEPVSETAAAEVLSRAPDSVSAYLADQTGGAVTLAGRLSSEPDIVGPLAAPAPATGCDPYGWADAADAAAAAAGVDVATYEHLIYALPSTSACSWSGLGQVEGERSWINGAENFSLRVVAHELGHNLGAWHAATLRCTDASGQRVPLGGSCRIASEYGDPFDIMGRAEMRHVSAAHKHVFGWLAGGVQTVTSEGTYELAPSSAAAGVRLLRIPRGGAAPLCLELRAAGGIFETWSPTDPAVTGVTARLCPAYDHTRLVDSTPATATYDDAPLTGGASLGDARYGIAVTAESVTPLGAVLRIHTGDLLAPGVPGGVAASVEDNAVRLSWSPASDNVGVTGYRVYRNGGRIATVAATSIVDAAPRDGAAYTVRAVDAAGNVGPASAPVTVRLPDRTPPTAAGAPTATLLSATAAEIAWTPASDDRGVAHYRVLIDGREVAAVAGTTHLLSGLAPGATYALAVVAVDAAGNAGPPAAGTLAVPPPPAPPASAPPAADAGRPAPVPAPAAPAWLRVEGTGPVALALRWAAATGARGVRGYEIHRNGVLVGTSRTPEFLDTGLTPGTAYTYLVRAYDGAGALGPATALTAVTRPQNLRLAVTQASVRRSGPRRWLVRLTVHTAERPRVRPACSYRVGLAAWRRCAFDGSGAARVISTLTVRRPAVVTVRAGDARTSVATVRHTVRP